VIVALDFAASGSGTIGGGAVSGRGRSHATWQSARVTATSVIVGVRIGFAPATLGCYTGADKFPATSMIRIEHLTKRFRKRPALDDVTLEIPAGSITGLLGPNGAGKSTLIGTIVGQVRPDAGDVRIQGVSVVSHRCRALRGVGAVFEAPGFYEDFTARENLACLASLSGPVVRAEIENAAVFVGLSDRIDEPVRRFSRGMRLRLAIAQALIPRPALVVLDEPMEGLDPGGIRDARRLIQRVRGEWKATVLLSSHLLSEIDQLCDYLAILNHGRVVFSGPWKGDARLLEDTYLSAIDGP
jgi:ABC-2 type transport system ATP-binding protein